MQQFLAMWIRLNKAYSRPHIPPSPLFDTPETEGFHFCFQTNQFPCLTYGYWEQARIKPWFQNLVFLSDPWHAPLCHVLLHITATHCTQQALKHITCNSVWERTTNMHRSMCCCISVHIWTHCYHSLLICMQHDAVCPCTCLREELPQLLVICSPWFGSLLLMTCSTSLSIFLPCSLIGLRYQHWAAF